MLKYGARLRAGEPISDEEFDAVYSPDVKSLSLRHWTPVSVARRAAYLLTDLGGAMHILDVGAGPGKFCIVGALSTTAHFVGVEHRRRLVEAAQIAAVRFGADRAHVVHGNLLDFDCRAFDGFYFYNPFREQLDSEQISIDLEVARSATNFKMYVATTIAKLIGAPLGTAVVTYCGFGGRMPPEYRRVLREEIGNAELALWVRSRSPRRLPGLLTQLDSPKM
jgi:SAM-dependent methyltransferase